MTENEIEDSTLNLNSDGNTSYSRDNNSIGVEVVGNNAQFSVYTEPIYLLCGMANSIMQIVVQSYYIDRVCRSEETLFDDGSMCLNLTDNITNEKFIESKASEYNIYQSLIENGFPIIMAFFLGPITDKYGYKPLILLSGFGYFISAILYTSSLLIPELNPKYILICSIPIALSGGNITLVISAYGYLNSQTTVNTRSIRMAALSISWDVGTLIGCLCGAKLFQRGGFLSVFLYASICYGVSLMYAVIFIKEQMPERSELISGQFNQSGFIKELLDSTSTSVKEMFQSCFKRRQGYQRTLILTLLLCITLQYLAYLSKQTSQYLFSRNKFGWSAEDYANYNAVNTLLGSVGGILQLLIFMKLFRLQDVVIVIVNCISNLAGYILFAIASAGWWMYMGSGVQMFGALTGSVIRSMLSKSIPADEYVRLLSFSSCVELSMPFIAGSLYNIMYINTEEIFPGAVFIFAAGLISVVLISSVILWCFWMTSEDYTFLRDEIEDS